MNAVDMKKWDRLLSSLEKRFSFGKDISDDELEMLEEGARILWPEGVLELKDLGETARAMEEEEWRLLRALVATQRGIDWASDFAQMAIERLCERLAIHERHLWRQQAKAEMSTAAEVSGGSGDGGPLDGVSADETGERRTCFRAGRDFRDRLFMRAMPMALDLEVEGLPDLREHIPEYVYAAALEAAIVVERHYGDLTHASSPEDVAWVCGPAIESGPLFEGANYARYVRELILALSDEPIR